jgi:hypothetical protein
MATATCTTASQSSTKLGSHPTSKNTIVPKSWQPAAARVSTALQRRPHPLVPVQMLFQHLSSVHTSFAACGGLPCCDDHRTCCVNVLMVVLMLRALAPMCAAVLAALVTHNQLGSVFEPTGLYSLAPALFQLLDTLFCMHWCPVVKHCCQCKHHHVTCELQLTLG